MVSFDDVTTNAEFVMEVNYKHDKVHSPKRRKITDSVCSGNTCDKSPIDIEGPGDKSDNSQCCITINGGQSNATCSTSQAVEKSKVHSPKRRKITDSVCSRNTCDKSPIDIEGPGDKSDNSQGCITINGGQSNATCSTSQAVEKVYSPKRRNITDSVCSGNIDIEGPGGKSDNSQGCITIIGGQSNASCSTSQAVEKSKVYSPKRQKILVNTDPVCSDNTCDESSIDGKERANDYVLCKDSPACIMTNEVQCNDTNCSTSHAAEKSNDTQKQCDSAREKILRNLKNLKEAFSHITPRKLLNIMSEHKLVSAEHIRNVKNMPKSLAYDYILIECTRKVYNEDSFENFAKVIAKINKTKKILWEAHMENPAQIEGNINLSFWQGCNLFEEPVYCINLEQL